MTKKIVFDLEEFKKFLSELDETEYDSGCRSTYELAENSYYLDEKDNRIKMRRTWHMNDKTTKVNDDFYDDMTIKGRPISEDNILINICEQIDILYYYAVGLIGKDSTHSLGFKKEKLKEFIEQKIKSL